MLYAIRGINQPTIITRTVALACALAMAVLLAINVLLAATRAPVIMPAIPAHMVAPASLPGVTLDKPLYQIDGRDDGYLGSYGG
jgi:hypothetical protein